MIEVMMNNADKLLFKKTEIEIIAVCRNCNEHWCTWEENEEIKVCQDCKKEMENYCPFEDVLEYLRKVKGDK